MNEVNNTNQSITPKKSFIVDYTAKIENKLSMYSFEPKVINDIMIILNYCFVRRNNFFISDFNKNIIKRLTGVYNKIRSNILKDNIYDIFLDISADDLKPLHFVIKNMVNNYTAISDNQENNELCSIIHLSDLVSILRALNNIKYEK